MARLFALDQNFPQPIVKVLQDFQADAELVPLRAIDERMSELDDWRLLLALHHHERPWDGLITTDSSILFQPLELSVLIQTRLTLVVTLEGTDQADPPDDRQEGEAIFLHLGVTLGVPWFRCVSLLLSRSGAGGVVGRADGL